MFNSTKKKNGVFVCFYIILGKPLNMNRPQEPSDDNKNREKFKESEKGVQKFVQDGENRNQALENDELFDISSYQPKDFDITKLSSDSFVVVVGKRRYKETWGSLQTLLSR